MPRESNRLGDKVVVVIGGARGIGRGITEACAAAGAQVVIADIADERDDLAAHLSAAGRTAFALALDACVENDHERAYAATVAHFGRLDVLVYCAGVFPRATLEETDEALWHRILDLNLTGAFLACRAAVPYMAAHGGGSIITIGSLHARCGSPNLLAYAVSKGGLVILTRNLANALAPRGIRVNCVHPGWVLSEGERAIRGLGEEGVAQFLQEAGSTIPMGRMQTPEDIAHAVVFLASDDAEQVTGQEITVDGGLGGRQQF